MIEWLLAPVDPSRAHEVGALVSWHGRLMVLAWGTLFPLGILIARFCKITRRQDWPRELDNKAWWHAHLGLQYTGGGAMLAALALILMAGGAGQSTHAYVGWVIVGFAGLQFLAGWFRGTKGGPTEPDLRGDHFDMTPRRLVFEHFHKFAGYGLLALAAWGVVSGMWLANALVWMWLTLGAWWTVLVAAFIALQRRGKAVDTYQAIWGPDPGLPGNQRKPIGWGVWRLDGKDWSAAAEPGSISPTPSGSGRRPDPQGHRSR
ncbi:MAG: cytochrome b561 domain-containing protein [Pseudomonadota bacterium]